MTQSEDTRVERFYIRCVDCLSFGVVEQPFQSGWHCSLCAGVIELMGKVVEDKRKYETEREVSACDKRCTHAVGPVCVCKCNCANHGTGRVVLLSVLNNLPTVTFKDDAEASAAGRGWRDRVKHLQATLEALQLGARNSAQFDYLARQSMGRKHYYGRNALRQAIESRTWKARQRYEVHVVAILNDLVPAWSKPAKAVR